MFGLTCSSFLLNATVRHHLTKYIDLEKIKHVIERLILNFYVDDSSTSFDKLSDAIEFYCVAKSNLDDANFDLCKWISNNFEFNKYVQSKNNDVMDMADLNDYRKVLGLQWQLGTDKIVFKLLPIYEFGKLESMNMESLGTTAG